METKESTRGKHIDWIDYIISSKLDEYLIKANIENSSKGDEIAWTIGGFITAIGIGYISIVQDNSKIIYLIIVLAIYFSFYYFIYKFLYKSQIETRLKKLKYRRFGLDIIHGMDKPDVIINRFNNFIISKILLSNSFKEKAKVEKNKNLKQISLSEAIYYAGSSINQINKDFFTSKEMFSKVIQYNDKNLMNPKCIPLFRVKENLQLLREILNECNVEISENYKWKIFTIQNHQKTIDDITFMLNKFMSEL